MQLRSLAVMLGEITSGGFCMSARPAATNPLQRQWQAAMLVACVAQSMAVPRAVHVCGPAHQFATAVQQEEQMHRGPAFTMLGTDVHACCLHQLERGRSSSLTWPPEVRRPAGHRQIRQRQSRNRAGECSLAPAACACSLWPSGRVPERGKPASCHPRIRCLTAWQPKLAPNQKRTRCGRCELPAQSPK